MNRFSSSRLKEFVPLCIGLIFGLLLITVSGVTANSNGTTSVAVPVAKVVSPPAAGPTVINGCVGNPGAGGTVSLAGRVITPSTLLRISNTCAANETALSWNTQGGGSSLVRTIIVSPVIDAPNTTNGTNLLNALAKIGTDPAYPAASATNPYLLKLEPGVYNVGSTYLQMKPYVDIEGSGEAVTTITGTGSNIDPPTSGTVAGANNSELRFVTVANTGGAGLKYATALSTQGVDASARFTHINARSSGAGNGQGMINLNASPTIHNSVFQVSGSNSISGNVGILNVTASPLIKDVIITVNGTGRNIGILNNVNCSPSIMDTNISVVGAGAANFGISNSSSTVSMANMSIRVSGAISLNLGIENNISDLNIQNSNIVVSGGEGSWGIYSASFTGLHSSIVGNSSITATGGSLNNIAIFNASNSIQTVNNSTLNVKSNSIGSVSFGISNTNVITLYNTTMTVRSSAGLSYGIANNNASLEGTANSYGSTIDVSGQTGSYGINNSSSASGSSAASTVGAYNSTITASSAGGSSRGVYSSGSASNNALAIINGSTIKGVTNALQVFSSGGGTQSVAKVGNTQLDGPVTVAGTATCVGVYDGNYASVPPACL